MNHDIPIIILSFARPALLEAMLLSLRNQTWSPDLSKVYLFQDGGSENFNSCIEIFKKVIPEGTIVPSESNLGIALNFDRAERFAFETLDVDVAYFFEDDLILGENYLALMSQLCEFAIKEPRVGYFAAYGNHRASLEQQKKRASEVVRMVHKWGFGLTKRQWLKQRDIIEPYLDIIRRDTYQRRDNAAILAYFRKLGYAITGSSQDGAKDVAGYVLGTTKIMSFACFARYEGKEGVHFRPVHYDRERFADTQIFSEIPTLTMPTPEILDTWIAEDRRIASASEPQVETELESKTMQTWYPSVVNVGPDGTPGTYNFMSKTFHRDQHFSYAEFGFYRADTARRVCELFPNATLHLFDFQENIVAAKIKLSQFPNRLFFYGNSQKYNDSYNWSLMQLMVNHHSTPIFDYCFLDGAHTIAVDGLTFFHCDRLLRIGGFIDFDDYNWKIRGSSLDPAKIPAIGEQYTDEQIDTNQVALIIDVLVKTDPRYKEIVPNKIYQKIS